MSTPEFDDIVTTSQDQKQDIEQIIEDRVSYKSLFSLHQIVNDLQELRQLDQSEMDFMKQTIQ